MAFYRLYFMNQSTDHIEAVREFEAADDSDAIMIAEGWRKDSRGELWCAERKIRSWAAES